MGLALMGEPPLKDLVVMVFVFQLKVDLCENSVGK